MVKSIKPGRGQSGMAVVGSVIAVLFGIVWLIAASSMTRFAKNEFPSFGPMDTASVVFPLFGFLFIGAGIANAIYHYRNYKGKERYSIVDIVDSQEEGDAANPHAKEDTEDGSNRHPAGKYCTECGHRLDADFAFCPGCGRNLNKNG